MIQTYKAMLEDNRIIWQEKIPDILKKKSLVLVFSQ
jgi:hypothetical protein